MFTGIVTETGIITGIAPVKGGVELQVNCSFASDTRVDESISVNGVCLTVVGRTSTFFTVQCVGETLRKTSFDTVTEGSVVNLERSLTLEKAIDGHIVQGHVDSTGIIEKISADGSDLLITVSFDTKHSSYLVDRGSISLDGISLTVARIEQNHFTVAVIPYTWTHTNLKKRKAGDRVNLEFDIFGKYIVRYLDQRFK